MVTYSAVFRVVAAAAVALGVLLFLPAGAVADPPTFSQPPDITVEATGPSTSVPIDMSSYVSDDNGPPSVACSPTSFPVGTTAVSCTATDTTTNETTSFGFNVIVTDTTPPTFNATSTTVEATSASGATVSFSATDVVDGSITPSCTPASGSTFPFGATSVDCTATDSHGNAATANFTVTVVDTTPPTLTVPAPITATAAGPAGATASFTVTATDIVDGAVPASCTPVSGSTFPIGTTTVACTATDTHGNVGNASFGVTVTSASAPPPPPPPPPPSGQAAPVPPTITVTGLLSATANGPPGTAVNYTVNATDPAGTVAATCSPASGTVFPVGATTVTCTAKGSSGISATKTFTVTVVDRTPPPPVTSLTTSSIDGGFVIHWHNPASSDFDHIEIIRTRLPNGKEFLLYHGNGTTFTDPHAKNPGLYRYTVFTVDASGNRNGVAVALHPTAIVLVQPANGATVTGPPMLRWVPQNATYYNVQLYRGQTKVLSVWPRVSHFAVPRAWRFRGQAERLQPGTYRWYVWPGVGSRKKHAFGALLGSSTFVVSQ